MKTALYLGLLLGAIPALAIAAVIELAIRYLGAGEWSDIAGLVVFGGIYLGLVAGGAYVFSRTRY